MADARFRHHPIFSRAQVDQYLDRIGIAQSDKVYDVKALDLDSNDAYDYLLLLQTHHLAHIPFENLALHYSTHRAISLHPDDVFDKIVASASRGGYCMELNATFGTLLRTLGYRLYATGARVCSEGKYSGWAHMLNLVSINNVRYMVDVGYGTNSPTQPLSMRSQDLSEEVQSIGQEKLRVVWKAIEDNECQDPRLNMWIYQHQSPKGDFKDQYCFSDLIEFRPEDFKVMNLHTSTSPRTIFAKTVFCTKMILDKNEKSICGRLTVTDVLKRSMGDDVEVLQTFETEDQRVEALKKYFSISLRQPERDAIKGTSTEIKGPPKSQASS